MARLSRSMAEQGLYVAFVEVEDVRLRYEQVGSGPRNVIFLHGNLGSVSWFELGWEYLSPQITATAFDFRGCGLSDKPEPSESYGNYSMVQLADDILMAMERLGISQADVVGHSTGALVALHMRFRNPSAVGKILAVDPATPMGVDLADRMHFFQGARNDKAKARALLSTMMASLFTESGTPPEGAPFGANISASQRELFDRLDAERHTASDGVWFGFARALTEEHLHQPLRSRLSEIDNPVFIVWGDRDVWVPEDDVREMAEKIPDCSVRVLQGIGQTVMVEDPRLFGSLVNEFLVDMPRAGRPADRRS